MPLGSHIVSFGPNSVVHSERFNVQPDGRSAMWVSLDTVAKPSFVLVLGGRRLETNVSGETLLTAGFQTNYSPGQQHCNCL